MAAGAHPELEALLAHAGWVQALARTLVADPGAADDAAQETWLAAMRSPPRERSAARGWLARVLQNQVRQQGRSEAARAGRERRRAAHEALPSAAEITERASMQRRLVDHVLALDEPNRSTLLYRFFEELSAEEIARRQGVPSSTVRNRVARGLELLRERLEREDRDGWRTWCAVVAGLGASDAATAAAIAGGIAMGAKLKLAAALAALASASWVGWHALDAPPEPAEPDQLAALAADLARADAQVAADASSELPAEARSAVPAPAAPATIAVTGMAVNLPYPGLADQVLPAAGALMRVVAAQSEWAMGEPSATATADELGRFRIEVPDTGQRPIHVFVSADRDERYRFARADIVLGAGEAVVRDARIERPAHGLLVGLVADEREAPLAGARVVFGRGGHDGVERGATTDAGGRFEIDGLVHALSPGVELEGWTLLAWTPFERLAAGGWKPARFVLAPAAKLVLRARDSAGLPVVGLGMQADLAGAEASIAGRAGLGRGPGTGVFGNTDERGDAELAVWGGKALRVVVRAHGFVRESEATSAGRLLWDASASGTAPIAVPSGGVLELVVPIDDALVLRGRVLYADGRPVPKPWLRVTERDAPAWQSGALDVQASGNEDGRFELPIETPRELGTLAVVAAESALVPLFGKFNQSAPSPQAALVEVDPARVRREAAELTVVVAPTFAVSGRVLDAQGEPVRAMGSRISAVPAGSGFPFERTALRVEASAWTEEGGSFRLIGLPPGRYDLYATQELESFYSYSTSLQNVSDILAGDDDVVVHLADRRDVRVRVRTSAPPGSIERLIVLHGKHFARGPDALAPAPMPHELTVTSLADWPDRGMLNFTGIGGREDERGRTQLGSYGTEETAAHDLPPLEAGWLEVGLQAYAGGKLSHFPMSTGLRQFEPGAYEIRFELVPVSELSGRVLGAPSDERIGLSLVDGAGRAIPLPIDKWPRSFAPLAADGRFALPVVPVGPFRLQVGTEDELARGAPRLALPVEIVPGENAPLEIVLR